MNQLLSFVLFGEGLLSGIMLTIMVGPVTMVIVRSGIQINRLGGIWAAIGTWVSDFIFITLTYWMTRRIELWSNDPSNKLTLYVSGGIGLLLVGLIMTRVRRNPSIQNSPPSLYRYSQAFAS